MDATSLARARACIQGLTSPFDIWDCVHFGEHERSKYTRLGPIMGPIMDPFRAAHYDGVTDGVCMYPYYPLLEPLDYTGPDTHPNGMASWPPPIPSRYLLIGVPLGSQPVNRDPLNFGHIPKRLGIAALSD